VLAPAGTARELIMRLHGELTRILQLADVKSRFAADGVEVVIDTPEQFGKYIRAEIVKWAKVAREAQIKQE